MKNIKIIAIFLLFVAVACELLCIGVFAIATMPSEELESIASISVRLLEGSERAALDDAKALLRAQHLAFRELNDVTRALGRVVGLIGGMIFVAALALLRSPTSSPTRAGV